MFKQVIYNQRILTTTLVLLVFVGGFVHYSQSYLAGTHAKNRNSVDGLGISKRGTAPPFEFRIYSNNVRYAATKRNPHEQPWDQRKFGVVAAIELRNSQFPTLVGLQECLHNQVHDVVEGLNNATSHRPYRYFGVGRDDGHKLGEYSPVVYNTDEWKLINGTTRWLSLTPTVPSIYSGASKNRIVTITTFKHKSTGHVVNYLNTHFDQLSADARNYSAHYVLSYVRETFSGAHPTFLGGDFNSVSTDISYSTLATGFVDTNTAAYNHYGQDLDTFSGFEPDSKQSNIDFIWAPLDSNKDDKTSVIGLEVLDNVYNGSRFSDHRPVMAHFKLWNYFGIE